MQLFDDAAFVALCPFNQCFILVLLLQCTDLGPSAAVYQAHLPVADQSYEVGQLTNPEKLFQACHLAVQIYRAPGCPAASSLASWGVFRRDLQETLISRQLGSRDDVWKLGHLVTRASAKALTTC